jgi:hypothetical protein
MGFKGCARDFANGLDGPGPHAGFERYRAAFARTELRSFGQRGHWRIVDEGWEEVAYAALQVALSSQA